MTKLYAAVILAFLVAFTNASAICPAHLGLLEQELADYAGSKDARIGVAVIFDSRDTVAVNGHSRFPMQSVYKFPQAIAVAGFCRENGISFTDTVTVAADEMKTDTWSPMRDEHGTGSARLTVAELLRYSLQQSDNNACDVLFRLIGGPAEAQARLRALGFDGISVLSTEDEMHRDINLIYENSATPVAMASLFDRFNTTMRNDGGKMAIIAQNLEQCETGTDRLMAPLKGLPLTAGHKTGTGPTDSSGRLTAINDAAYVNLDNGRHYAIAVFVADSRLSMKETSAIIAEISAIVYRAAVNGTCAH